MKRHSKIIKEFGLFLLLFVSVSVVAVSEDTNGEFTDTIAIFGNDSVWTNSEKDTTVYESASGETSETSVTTGETSSSEGADNTNTGESTDSNNSNADDNSNSVIVPPNSNPGELTYKGWSIDEWWEQVLSAAAGEDMILPPLPSVEDAIDFTAIGNFP